MSVRGTLCDLEDICVKWAMVTFDKTRQGSQKKLNLENLCYNLDWKRVQFVHDAPVYTKQEKSFQPNAVSLFKTCFSNTTSTEQNYSFQTTRTTRSSATVTMSSTFTKGGNASLTLKVPGDVLELGGGFSRELSVTKESGETFEEELSWSVNSDIKVPGKHKTVAEVNISEMKYNTDFTVRTTVSGRLQISVTNPEDNNAHVSHIDTDIFQVIKSQVKVKADVELLPEEKQVVFTSRGHVLFNFGTEQNVCIKDEPWSALTNNCSNSS